MPKLLPSTYEMTVALPPRRGDEREMHVGVTLTRSVLGPPGTWAGLVNGVLFAEGETHDEAKTNTVAALRKIADELERAT